MNVPLRNLLVRFWRITALVAAALLIHRSAKPPAENPPFSLQTAQEFFPNAARLSAESSGVTSVFDAGDESLGSLVTTSPQADHITGYAGPSNLLVAIDKGGRIRGSKILESADTPSHVEALRKRELFSQSLIGWNPSLEPSPHIDGIGGSTLTGLAMVEGIAQRLGGAHASLRFPDPVSLEEVRHFFPNATTLETDEPLQGWHRVLLPNGAVAGYVVRTSPAADGITGYAGPTECLVAVAPDQQTILEVTIRKSYDTEDYADRVREDKGYLKSLTQWKVSQWPTLNFEAEKFEGVAGATLTSASIAEGLREKFKLDTTAASKKPRSFSPQDLFSFGVLSLALLLSFTKLRGYKWLRVLWQTVLIGGVGLWLGQFLSVGLLVGWARHGAPLHTATPLVALGIAALLTPWAARRQIYCHQLCPHGAAQDWLSRVSARHFQLPRRLHDTLRLLPGLLLAAAFLAAIARPDIPLGALEAFDFWTLGTVALLPACIALAGLATSVVVPMAYCHYGCPTGALLGFIRSASTREHFQKRDAIALLLLLCGFFLTPPQHSPRPTENTITLRGAAFGTTWSVKLRDPLSQKQQTQLHSVLSEEINRIEATLSHWSKTSATSRFNASNSTEEQEIPEELGALVAFAQRLHTASSGAYDLTVAPLVAAWGYGPPGTPDKAPSKAEIDALLASVGSDKLFLSTDRKHLRKSQPSLALDLGSILQGYAVDRCHALLKKAGCHDFLIEVGGELRAEKAWRVAIENPADALHPLEIITLENAALATSGLARARRKLSGQTVSHIISPKTGYPVLPTIEECSVQCRTCLDADGWATAVIASGLPNAEALSKAEHLSVWILESKGGFRRLE